MKLIAEHVKKNIGKKEILKDVNLTMEDRYIYGFIGKNGSEKTMLFRALSGLMNISSGEIRLDNQILHKDMKVLPSLGLIIENAGLYPELTGLNNLKLLAKINSKIGDEEIYNAIKRVGLDPDDKRPFRKYSLGMKQRIIIAQAIMEKPDIIMLDEPTNALDIDGVEEIRNIIMEEKKRGTLILIASHNTDDIDLLADKVYTVNEGIIEEREAM